MFACLAPLCLVAALGQAPGEAEWLKSIPGDVAVVVRVKALETARDDLLKMLEAMSGNAAALARPQIEQGLAVLNDLHGKVATQNPILAVMRLPKDGAPMPPLAVLIESKDYLGTLRGIAKKEDLTPKSLGGYDSFEMGNGQTMYAAKGAGFVAFGPDEALIKGMSKPDKALSESLSSAIKDQIFGGDLGVYVNVASLQGQYADQIEQGKQMAMGMFDQAGAQMPGNMKDAMKEMYGALFDAVKTGDAIAFHLDFAAEGLGVAGVATVKADSPAAKKLASARTGSGDLLGKLPAGGVSFAYANIDPEAVGGLQKLGLSMLTGQSKPSPEMQKALDLQRQGGPFEVYTSSTGAGGSMSNVSISTPKDPAQALEAARLTTQAMKSGEGFIKDVKLTPKAQTYKGIAFDEATMTFDLDKMVTPGAPGGVEGIRKMMGGDTAHVWYGTDGKVLFNVSGKTFDEAKPQVDSILSGAGSVGKTAGFEAIRAKFPKQVTALVLVSAQGMVKQMANQIGAMTGKADLVIPSDMPKEPAFLGGSLTSGAKGIQFQVVIPSAVGPVIEKGLVPLLQGLQGPIQ